MSRLLLPRNIVMFWLIYNVLLLLGFPVIVGLLLTRKRCQRGLRGRLGHIPNELKHLSRPVVWAHAASLGEVTAVVPLLKAMKKEDPQQVIVVSTVTETGREMVQNQLKGVAIHCYAPLDFWWAVHRYVQVLNPRLFLLVESEIWPNLLTSLAQKQVPVCLVNGRISTRSYSRYRMVKRSMKRIWSFLDMALMQTPQDAERIIQLGANENVVHVTGNMKFDQAVDPHEKFGSTLSIRTTLGVRDAEFVIVAGSTHPQEEEQLLQAYQSLSQSKKNLVLVLAPRHIERASELEAVISRFGLSCVRRSQMNDENVIWTEEHSPRVILLDSRGELPNVYRVGFVGFVGGTLVPIGGHNLLEPAQWGRPVIFGPHVDHCHDSARRLLQAGGAIQIHEPKDLGAQLLYLLENSFEAEQMGERAFAVVEQNRGVVNRNLQMIRQLSIHQPIAPSPVSPSHDSSKSVRLS